MIELLPFQMIPLIQLWATISVLFFYQNFFEKHPLEPQLNKLNIPLNRFYEQFQGFIDVSNPYSDTDSNYLAAKWDDFYVSIKRMTALIFCYSIFLLLYFGLYKDYHDKPELDLYHSEDIFFLTTTNIYMLLWLSWHLIKPIRKIWKLFVLFLIEILVKIIQGLEKIVETKYFLRIKKFAKQEDTIKNKLERTGRALKEKRSEKSNAILSTRKKQSKRNIRIIRMYITVIVLFLFVLLLYFAFFKSIDFALQQFEIKHNIFVHHHYSICHCVFALDKECPTFETLLTFVTLFTIVPIFIIVRVFFDIIQIKNLRNIFSNIPSAEYAFLLDVLSMRKEDIQKISLSSESSKQIFLTVKEFKGKNEDDVIEKQDIRDYLKDKVDRVITALAKGFLEINSENPILGEKFSKNQENQIEKVVKKQIDLSNDKLMTQVRVNTHGPRSLSRGQRVKRQYQSRSSKLGKRT